MKQHRYTTPTWVNTSNNIYKSGINRQGDTLHSHTIKYWASLQTFKVRALARTTFPWEPVSARIPSSQDEALLLTRCGAGRQVTYANQCLMPAADCIFPQHRRILGLESRPQWLAPMSSWRPAHDSWKPFTPSNVRFGRQAPALAAKKVRQDIAEISSVQSTK